MKLACWQVLQLAVSSNRVFVSLFVDGPLPPKVSPRVGTCLPAIFCPVYNYSSLHKDVKLDSPMKTFFQAHTLRTWLLWSLVGLTILVLIVLIWPYLPAVKTFFANQEAISSLAQGFGLWGPLLIALLHAVQIFIPVIPGYIILIASGYVYGFWGGFFLSLVITVGLSQAAFSLARWGGRPLVERFVRPESLTRWDRLASRYGVFFFMIAFMLPVFQADLMNYVAGLSSLSARKFFLANLLGRIPGVVVMTAIGAYGLAFSPVVWVVFVVGGLLLLLIGWWVLRRFEATFTD